MTYVIVLVLIFLTAVILVNNKYLDTGVSYLLAGIVSFSLVIGIIFLVTAMLL